MLQEAESPLQLAVEQQRPLAMPEAADQPQLVPKQQPPVGRVEQPTAEQPLPDHAEPLATPRQLDAIAQQLEAIKAQLQQVLVNTAGLGEQAAAPRARQKHDVGGGRTRD